MVLDHSGACVDIELFLALYTPLYDDVIVYIHSNLIAN